MGRSSLEWHAVPASKAQLRSIPAVETVLQHPGLARAANGVPRTLLIEAVRAELAEARTRLKKGGKSPDIDELAGRIAARATAEHRPELRRVLNATGVVLHTNLGRAPLAESARRALDRVGRGYSNLEFDLAKGRRGERGTGVERWLA